MIGEKNVRITALANQSQAALISSVLDGMNIPHVVVVHSELFLEGIYSVRDGWGHVEAPEAFREEIERVAADLSGPAAGTDAQ